MSSLYEIKAFQSFCSLAIIGALIFKSFRVVVLFKCVSWRFNTHSLIVLIV